MVDPDGKIIHFNPACERTTGYSSEEVLGRSVWDLFATPEEVEKAKAVFATLRSGKSLHEHESYWMAKDGRRRLIAWSNTALLGADGSVQVIIGTGIDVTERELAAEELQYHQAKLHLLASRLALAEENERLRIAVDLHDVAAQDLALAMMKVRALKAEETDADTIGHLAELHDLLEATTLELRSLSRSLSPPELYAIGLEAALESLAERFQAEQGIPCPFEDDGRAKPLAEDATKTLYRCVRELLANAARHADAANVHIAISRSDHSVEVVVSDDGIGFAAGQPRLGLEPSGGFGLLSVQEGMRALGGELKLRAQPGCGTRATLTMPVGGMREPE